MEQNELFHIGIAKLAMNNMAVEMMQKLLAETNKNIMFMGSADHDYQIMDNCHAEIVDALLQRDFERAAKALYEDFMPTIQSDRRKYDKYY